MARFYNFSKLSLMYFLTGASALCYFTFEIWLQLVDTIWQPCITHRFKEVFPLCVDVILLCASRTLMVFTFCRHLLPYKTTCAHKSENASHLFLTSPSLVRSNRQLQLPWTECADTSSCVSHSSSEFSYFPSPSSALCVFEVNMWRID